MVAWSFFLRREFFFSDAVSTVEHRCWGLAKSRYFVEVYLCLSLSVGDRMDRNIFSKNEGLLECVVSGVA